MSDVAERLVVWFVVGALLLNFPILAIFNRPATIGGMPVLYLYLFGVWIVAILALFVLARHRWSDEE